MEPENLLPAGVLARAVRTGGEYAWRSDALPTALGAARGAGLAVLGGQVQFVFPDGTYELFWQSYDATDRRPRESWRDYVARSHGEVEAALGRLPDPDGLVRDALATSEFLRARAADGLDLRAHLCYVCYFAAEDGA